MAVGYLIGNLTGVADPKAEEIARAIYARLNDTYDDYISPEDQEADVRMIAAALYEFSVEQYRYEVKRQAAAVSAERARCLKIATTVRDGWASGNDPAWNAAEDIANDIEKGE
jgi:hypothetical protein